MSNLRICVAGATGWAGSALSRGIAGAPDLDLVAAISRSQAGKVLLAAALIHSAGYAGFVLVENEEAQLDAARATLVAIDVARRREPRE